MLGIRLLRNINNGDESALQPTQLELYRFLFYFFVAAGASGVVFIGSRRGRRRSGDDRMGFFLIFTRVQTDLAVGARFFF